MLNFIFMLLITKIHTDWKHIFLMYFQMIYEKSLSKMHVVDRPTNNKMKNNLLIPFFTLLVGFNYGQSKSSSFIICDNWISVIFRDTIQLEMVLYVKAYFYCGTFVDNAFAICKDEKGDTLRVIELCPGPKNYKTGQKFKFITYPFITKDKKTYQKHLPSDETATERLNYIHIKPTSFGKLQPINN